MPVTTRAAKSPGAERGRRTKANALGTLLQYWRDVRGKSQLALALEAEVSPRHVSFVETGRARASREMVLRLARALDVPLRERNGLLLAAGFAPMFQESSLDSPQLRAARRALDAILAKQEPHPAVVMNRSWDILESNTAATTFFLHLLGGVAPPGTMNVVRMMFDETALRPYVANWPEVAAALVQRVHREAVGGITDEATTNLLAEVMAYPGVTEQWARRDDPPLLAPIIPITFVKDGSTYSFFSAITTLGTPQDVTLQELRIESFFPLDEETTRNMEALVARR